MSQQLSDSLTQLVTSRNAALTSVAVFDVSQRTQIEVTGGDRARFLHSFTSNDIKRLKAGQGCETFITSLKGKVVAHVFVFCTEQSLWLDGTPGQQVAITNHLSKFLLIDDVQLVPREIERGELFVTGPLATSLLQLDDSLAVGGNVSRETGGVPFDIRRVDLFDQPGYLLSIPQTRIDTVKRSLIGLGVNECLPELFDIMRIESGYPDYGVDITEDNLAQEVARTKQCISFDKGCYLGQETIARLDALGHTNRELRRLRFETNSTPSSGSSIFDEIGATEIGVVTSAAQDLANSAAKSSGSVNVLGYLKRTACQIGTKASLKIGESVVAGQVL